MLASTGICEFTKIGISIPEGIRRSYKPQHLWGQTLPEFH